MEDRRLLRTLTWDGNANSANTWSTAGNWQENAVPAAGDVLIFPASVSGADLNTNNDLGFRVYERIEFARSGYVIRGKQFAVGSGGIRSSGAGENQIQTSTQFRRTVTDVDPTIETVGATKLTFTSVVQSLTGTNLVKSGSGVLKYAGSVANTLSGTTRITEGNLELAKSTKGLNAIAGPLVLEGSSQAILLQSEQINGPVTLNPGTRLELGGQVETVGLLSLGADSIVSGTSASKLILSQDVQGLSGRTFAVARIEVGKVKLSRGGSNPATVVRLPGLNAVGMTLLINAAIEGLALRQEGGTLVMGGAAANTYTGETVVALGELVLDKPDGVLAIPGNLTITKTTPGAFAQVTLNGEGQVSQFSNLTMAGTAILELNGHRFLQASGSSAADAFTTLTMTGGTIRNSEPLGQFEMPAVVKILASASPSRIQAAAVFKRVSSTTKNTAKRFHSIDIASGATLVVENAVQQFVSVNPESRIDVTGLGTLEWTQRAGVPFDVRVNVANSRVLIHNQVANQGALVGSPGTLFETDPGAIVNVASGSLTAPAILSPGNSSTPVTSISMKEVFHGIHRMDLNGPGFDEFDRMIVTQPTLAGGGVFLFGTLDIRVNFASQVGNTFDIMRINTVAATEISMRNIDGTFLSNGSVFQAGGRSFRIDLVNDVASRLIRLTHVNTPPAFQDRVLSKTILEGEEAILTGRITEPDSEDTFILDVDWGDGVLEQIVVPPGSDPLLALRHRYVQDGRYNVNLAWRDQHGTSLRTAVETVKVINVGPRLHGLSADDTTTSGTPFSITGLVEDPGEQDPLTIRVDWGDGGPEEVMLLPQSRTFHLQHTFANSGHRTIRLIVTDDDTQIVETLRVRVR